MKFVSDLRGFVFRNPCALFLFNRLFHGSDPIVYPFFMNIFKGVLDLGDVYPGPGAHTHTQWLSPEPGRGQGKYRLRRARIGQAALRVETDLPN